MLSRSGRPLAQKVFGPVARAAVKAGISADAITITGTVLTCAIALTLVPTGHLALAAIVLAIVVIFDNLDGQVARLTGSASPWGAFLDSTLDRFADAAIFTGVLAWAYLHGQSNLRIWLMVCALAALVFGSIVPYARARAEGIGAEAAVGLAERADRLAIILLALLLVGFGLPHWVLLVALIYLAVAAFITVIQRMMVVRKQTKPKGLLEGRPAEPEDNAGGTRMNDAASSSDE